MIILYMPINQNNLILDKNLISLLSKERQDSLSVCKNENNIIHSMYAELLLKYGLSKFYGISEKLEISRFEGGKPYLVGHPSIDFNISHTSGMVMCGITDNGKIGVDVDHIRKVHKNVALKVYNEAEINYINEIEECYENRFFEIWTKKEAYTKYLGTGLRNNLTDINMLSKEHSNDLLFWNEEQFFFSVYSDSEKSKPLMITVEELQEFFL